MGKINSKDTKFWESMKLFAVTVTVQTQPWGKMTFRSVDVKTRGWLRPFGSTEASREFRCQKNKVDKMHSAI